jgi:hypothetical protein
VIRARAAGTNKCPHALVIPAKAGIHEPLWKTATLERHHFQFPMVRDETTWAAFRRYSSFRGRSEPLEGVVGSAEYAGPVEEFLPLLVMGGLTHVGKRAVFGLGRYRIA